MTDDGTHMTETSPRLLSVNGSEREVQVDDDVPLLYVLRNDLGLTGTMFGCGSGECGACFVMLDDTAVPSCDTPVWMAADKPITTIEKVGDDGPLADAFIEEQAGQCCYCLSGIMVSAEALLRRSPNPSEDEVRSALDRNLCRCGAHNRMVRAVLRAAEARNAEGAVHG